jgi:hypothetical protein
LESLGGCFKILRDKDLLGIEANATVGRKSSVLTAREELLPAGGSVGSIQTNFLFAL